MEHPYHRPRRMRVSQSARRLIQEHHLSAHQLIYPVFVIEGANQQQEIDSMPGVRRYSIDRLVALAEHLLSLGIGHMALFPVVDVEYKNASGSYALDEDGLLPRAIRYLKARVPDMRLVIDVALDPYTSHGHDGILDDAGDYVMNDATVKILVQQSLLYAQCGTDIIAPSDMMDGRIRAIRDILEVHDYHQVALMAYSAKYASNLYGPFRDAVGSKNQLGKASKSTYQMHPANVDEALREAALDIQEGADILMVKPGSWYLDVIHAIKQKYHFPVCAYHVSGEYSMLKLAEKAGLIDYPHALLELWYSFKRAGADMVISYAAVDMATLLAQGTM